MKAKSYFISITGSIMNRNSFRRRGLLRAGGLILTTGLAGCTTTTSGNEEETTDSDGDGVPDEHDYAPRDPDVQTKQDALGRTTATPQSTPTTTSSPTPTSTPSPTPTSTPFGDIELNESLFETETPTSAPPVETPPDFDLNESLFGTPTPTRAPDPQASLPQNEVLADAAPLDGRVSHFTAYSMQSATVALVPETIQKSFPTGARLLVIASPYPDELFSDDDIYGHGRSGPFSLDTTTKQTVPLTFEETPDSSFYLRAIIVPKDTTLETFDADAAEYLGESNRLRIESGQLRAEEPSPETDDFAADGFERNTAEGCYLLEFSGSSGGTNWNASFIAYKSNYVEASGTIRTGDRASYVRDAQESGLADQLATILSEEAEWNGFTSKQEQVEFVIDFVQNLPYVPDDVSTEFDDYTKSVTETLVEGGGDCEDSAILMAAILQSEAFNYDCILIQPPGHMAVGVYGTDLPGTYWEHDGRRYYYLETTGDGWSVGELPEAYEGESAYLHEV